MDPRPPLLLDVCGTLYDANTSVAFLRRLGRTSPAMRARWVAGAALAWVRRRTGAGPGDCMRARIRMLRGIPSAWIAEQADRFVEELESTRAFRDPLRNLDDALAAGRETWLVSATLDEILQAVARRHPGVRVLGSSLAHSDGICLGTYAEFLLDTGKLAALSRLLPAARIADAEFATDDLDADADLAAAVRELHHVRGGTWT